MSTRGRGLLSEIERDAMSEDRPLASTLRKCVILGGRAGSTELRQWATRELRGYELDDELPKYRIIPAPIRVDAMRGNYKITGQRISPGELPDVVAEHIDEEVQIRSGIREIEALAKRYEATDESARFSLPGGADVVRLMNYEIGDRFQQVMEVYWAVSGSALQGIVDRVRTALAELIGELLAGMPEDQNVPSAELANQAVNVAVSGKKSRVTVAAARSSRGGVSNVTPAAREDVESPFWTTSRKIGAVVVGIATILAAVVAILEWLG
jgi:hypothetical protein